MILYRVSRRAYALDVTGEGARLAGGRWNPKGAAVLYAAEHPALAMLEYMPQFRRAQVPVDICLVTLEIPAVTVETLDIAVLPENWNYPVHQPETIAIGKNWLDTGATSILRVPSAMGPVGKCWNYLLNPIHPDLMGKISATMEQWDIDPRLQSILNATRKG